MTEVSEIFTELFYGSGSWLMLIILVSIIMIVSLKVKYSCVIFIPICLFLGLSYLDNATEANNLLWHTIIIWILPIFSILIEVKTRKK